MEIPITEDQLTAQLFKWWDSNYPQYRGLLFHVPNGGERRGWEANKFKAMGVWAGVSDFILLWKGCCFCIELKLPKGSQSEQQEYWQYMVESEGFMYVIIRDLESFKKLIWSIIGR